MRVLVIEDDQATALAIKETLEEYYLVEVAYSGKEGLEKALTVSFDLITLDIKLPDINGIEICKQIRKQNLTVPILMLTSQDVLDDKIKSLDLGADDYLIKPFHFDELLARIRALLRRKSNHEQSDSITINGLTIDLNKKTVTRENRVIPLRRKEFHLLEYLMRNAGKVISRDMILDHVWHSMSDPSTNTIDVHIKYLRDLIDKPFGTHLIKTVHGMGYKIEPSI